MSDSSSRIDTVFYSAGIHNCPLSWPVQDLASGKPEESIRKLHSCIVRDCMRRIEVETLGEACRRPKWKVPKADFEIWFDLRSQSRSPPGSSPWILGGGGEDGQLVLLATENRLHCKRPLNIMAYLQCCIYSIHGRLNHSFPILF